jgi:predicted CopG family antitoxin
MLKTIKIEDAVHARLAKHGTIGERFQDVIVKLLDYYEKGSKK